MHEAKKTQVDIERRKSKLNDSRPCFFGRSGLIIHIFCFSLGASVFGVGYAALPVFMLLVWVIACIFKGEIKVSEVLGVSSKRDISWVVLFYLLFIMAAVVSDLVNGGDWSHRDGPLTLLAIGFYMFLGGLTAAYANKKHKQLLETYQGWCVFWGLVLALVAEARYGWKIYSYSSGVFDNINQLMATVSMLGAINWALFLENIRDRKILSFFSFCVAIVSVFCVLEHSTSDILPFICVVSYALVLFLCETKFALLLLLFCVVASSFYLIREETISQLNTANFIKVGYWKKLLNHREEILTVSSRVFSKKPLLGVGAGNFKVYYSDVLQSAKDLPPKLQVFDQTHNVWIQHFVTHGVYAGLFFVCFLLSELRLIILGLCSERTRKLSLPALGMFFVFN